MADYIKLNNEWVKILDVYRKENGSWVLQTDISSSILTSNIYFYSEVRIDDEVTYVISGVSSYTGKSFTLTYIYNNKITSPTWSIISGNQYATINSNGKVEIDVGVINETIVVQAVYKGRVATKTITISYDNQLAIEGADTITGTTGNVIARYNSNTVNPTWSLTAGNAIATINSAGQITILDSGTIVVQAEYHNYTASKQIELVYDAGTTTETTIDENGTVTTETTSTSVDPETGAETTTTTTVVTNEDGSSTTTSVETTENQDGSSTTNTSTTSSDGTTTETTSTSSAPDPETGAVTTEETTSTTNPDGTSSETTSTIVENQDGSSETTSTTVNYDENGDETGSTTSEITNNSDGSYAETTTNYDVNGDPTDQTNQTGDSSGNVSTQTIEYNDNGDPVVTGYDIDTSGNEDGTITFNGDGVNTDYYAFDLTHGFELELHFTFDFSQQPTGQNENHHNILTMKRATPEPWYGFQLRQTGTNKYIILGTQFATGSNANTTITTTNDNKVNGSSNLYEYDIKIIYDPTQTTNSFVCNELIGGFTYSSNLKFPDLEDLKYLKVTIGYAMDANGDPFRYSNIDVTTFYIKKLHNIDNPVITCDGQTITITCETSGANIYYRLGTSGNYSEYIAPISINADTTIQAYSQLVDEKSEIITRTFAYDNGIDEPLISCDGHFVTLSCSTSGTTIYYRLFQTGSYLVYSSPIEISEDTLIQTYASLNGERSEIVAATCLYDNGIETPIISCDGEVVTIGCNQANAEIYYRLDETGSFTVYTSAISIYTDTVVEAYVEVNGAQGHTAIETCVYDPILLDPPVILCNGTEITITCPSQGATIYYKLNNTGNYIQYTAPIAILEDTFVETYSTLRGKMSSLITDTCYYSLVHDYSQDYLTFRIRTNGTVWWHSNGNLAKTIEYSLNNGAWTSITATDSATSITVHTNDSIRFRGTNQSYATSKSAYSGFGYGEHGTSGQSDYDSGAAEFDIEGNIMSLIYGDNFSSHTTFNGGTYNFCSMFKKAKCVSAEHLILPATTLREYCYRAMFSWATYLIKAPALPGTTLAKGVYWYMFEKCAITEGPDLLAETLVAECYGSMFTGCSSLNYIKCLANAGFNTTNCKQNWVNGVASSGTFVKDSGTAVSSWGRGQSGIPTNWLVYDDVAVGISEIAYDGFDTITLSCQTQGADIYYRLNNTGNYILYTTPITISGDTVIQTYAEFGGQQSRIISQTCTYVSDVPIEESNRDLTKWTYENREITTPYSVNAIDGHSATYAKGTFNFTSSFALRTVQPTYLWFQHADQSATIYIDDVMVEKHWGGYTAFTVDITNYIHTGTNNVKVALKNNEGNNLAPANADFNFNATLGNVRLLTSPVVPDPYYGYDGFHVISTVTDALATVNVKTKIPAGASVVCSISDGTYSWTDTQASTGLEQTFTATITNPHLWNGKSDPHLYDITLEIYKNNVLYHRFVRPYGLRYYEYVINDTTILQNQDPYTGFLLNGSPYLLRGCCMHDDIAGKANALNAADYTQTFSIIQELNLNFLRLAHYPHPKEVYDWCDQLGIIVQTEGPCVNKMQSTMPTDYFDHLEIQYSDMVCQHMNHPCIMFWGLSNETQVDDKDFAKAKAESYKAIIKNIDPERWVGYVVAMGATNPSAHYNYPNLDWFGANIYIGWYSNPNSNNPSNEINKRIANTVTALSKPLAYSEYGCGGTQHCHSDDFMTTTTRGNNERHDIEYMMWLHEGQIAAIKNYPELLFTAEWQLFDIAVSNRNEGYTICLDGETVTTNDDLRRLNNKGLVERDHITKKDTFYLYKAWWNPNPFVHICGKDYTKMTNRVIKCYSNDGSAFTLKVTRGGSTMTLDTTTATNNIVTFSAQTFVAGDIITVEGTTTSDTLTFVS